MSQFTSEALLFVVGVVLGTIVFIALWYFFMTADATGLSPGMKGLAPLMTRG